jgi:predicted dehydrogenase/nucleoside-diphosphate-sugar epimerase
MQTTVQEQRRAKWAPLNGPARVAVVGCGAISRSYHLPVLAGHEGVRLAALVDRDVERARELARSYGVPCVAADINDLAPGSFDAAVVATPPSHHAPCCVELARRGVHVLVEKPIAVRADDARAMVEAARAAGVVLTAGYFRRLFPAVRLLRAALDGRALGRVIGFDAEEGDEYTWGLATLSNLRKDQGGGGVLIDIGSHVLDLLLYLFPDDFEVLEYRDNALGGIETDCLLRLRLGRDGEAAEGRVELSRTRRLRSTLRILCERGTLELRTGERYKVAVVPEGIELCDPDRGTPRAFNVQGSWADEPEATGYEAYRAEIDDWLDAIRTGAPARLDAASAVRTAELIERCYGRSGRLEEPWVWEGISRPADAAVPAQPRAPRRRVLITGASGFIGCRTAEVLHLGHDWDVRALVHRPSGAARLARLPVEMVQGDLKSPQDMARAVQGCDAVVHCAIGTAYGQRREIFAVTVDGTRNLARAALVAGVQRFVHLSSIAVHGTEAEGVLDESTPVRPTCGDDYSESKAAAEKEVLKAAAAGLPAVVLRPGNVYGPFSKTFSVRPVQYLRRGALVLAGSAETPSNTVYVDNLVQAIVRGLEAPAEAARGEVFTISEGDEWTWGEFYGYFARALGATVRTAPAEPPPRRAFWSRPLRWLGSWWGGARTILTSAELRALGKRVLRTRPWGTLPRWFLERFPGVDRRVRRLVGTEAVTVYRRPEAATADVMKVRPRGGLVRVDKARRVLGYQPVVPRERAMELTLEWLREARLA